MHFFRKPYAWAICFSLILLLFTAWIALDTFIIPRAYAVVEAQVGTAETQAETQAVNSESTDVIAVSTMFTDEAVISEDIYSDKNISITISGYRAYDTSIYVADIYLSSIDYLKTAFAENTYGKNITEKTSEIASEQSAILAVNGDFYGARKSGYVIRNGQLYSSASSDDTQEDLVINNDGSFSIIHEGEITAAELLTSGALQVLSFGPGLIENGEISVSNSEEVDKAKTSNPRTAIGMISPLHYVMMVSDGRTSASEGLTLYQLALVMQDLGVSVAYNLDGGGSSTMVFNGDVINNPTTDGKRFSERKVSDIVYIG